MVFKTTSSTLRIRARRGFLLSELMIGIGVGTLVLCVVAAVTLYSARSFAILNNYSDLSATSAHALDQITKDVRQATGLTSFATNKVTFQMGSNTLPVTFTYNSQAQTLTRQSGALTTVLLTDCNSLGFSLYQRTPIKGTYDQYPSATSNDCKVMSVSWVCSRKMVNLFNTENAQSAKIVLRR